jgi:hypothetical protein
MQLLVLINANHCCFVIECVEMKPCVILVAFSGSFGRTFLEPGMEKPATQPYRKALISCDGNAVQSLATAHHSDKRVWIAVVVGGLFGLAGIHIQQRQGLLDKRIMNRQRGLGLE